MNDIIETSIELAYTVPLCDGLSHPKILKCAIKSIIKNRKGFTLAETLITLTIIGVIAAMTIPTLMTNYQKHVYVTGLKKAYAQLQNASKMLPLSQGCSAGDYECAGIYKDYSAYNSSSTGLHPRDVLTKLFAEQFKTDKVVLTAEESAKDAGCQSVGKIYGGYNVPCFYTADGMVFTASLGGHPGAFAQLMVDLNGPKGPNKKGRDHFMFRMMDDSSNQAGLIVPVGYKDEQYYPESGCAKGAVSTGNWQALGCTAKVLNEGKMDY